MIKLSVIGMPEIISPTSFLTINTGKKAAMVVRDAANTGANIRLAA